MEKPLSLIDSEPKLAIFLHGREPFILPSDFYHWVVSWVEDVGKLMRSREYKVSILASEATYSIISNIASVFPMIGRLKTR